MFGTTFRDMNALKQFCMQLYNERADKKKCGRIFAVYHYGEFAFFAGSLQNIPSIGSERASFPEGVYLEFDVDDMDFVADFLIQTTFQVDHENLLAIKEYDLENNRVKVYYRLRSNGLNLTTLPRLSDEESIGLRTRYVERFTLDFSNNPRPYLWERLKEYNPQPTDTVFQHVDPDKDVYFFWDANASFKLMNELGQKSIYKLPFREFVYHYEQKNLPEDVYLFDASLTWTIVLTHEPQNEHGWKCLTIPLFARNIRIGKT